MKITVSCYPGPGSSSGTWPEAVGRKLHVPDYLTEGWIAMTQYSTQILICFIAYILCMCSTNERRTLQSFHGCPPFQVFAMHNLSFHAYKFIDQSLWLTCSWSWCYKTWIWHGKTSGSWLFECEGLVCYAEKSWLNMVRSFPTWKNFSMILPLHTADWEKGFVTEKSKLFTEML